MPRRKNNSPAFVRVDDCRERHGFEDKKIQKMELALFGEDGRGGMVADISEIKNKLTAATSILRSIVLPIVIPLIVGVIMYFVGKGKM